MDCQWTPADSVPATCTVCGTVYRGPSAKPPRRNCRPGGVLDHVPRVPGVGDHLERLLKADGFGHREGCGCPELQAKMNAWGPAGCREHREEILDHMLDEARRRHWHLDGRPIRSLIARAGCELPGVCCAGLTLARRWAAGYVDSAIAETERGREGQTLTPDS